MLASEGQSLGLVSRRVYLLILGTTAVTLVLNALCLAASFHSYLPGQKSLPWLKGYLERTDVALEVADELPTQNHVVVCGYGQLGTQHRAAFARTQLSRDCD